MFTFIAILSTVFLVGVCFKQYFFVFKAQKLPLNHSWACEFANHASSMTQQQKDELLRIVLGDEGASKLDIRIHNMTDQETKAIATHLFGDKHTSSSDSSLN